MHTRLQALGWAYGVVGLGLMQWLCMLYLGMVALETGQRSSCA